MLTRSAILAANDLARKEVEVPEWGGSVYVRQFTGAELIQKVRPIVKDNPDNAEVMLVVWACVDEDGNQLFTEADIEALEKKNGAVIQRIAAEALLFNFGPDEEAKKD